MTPTPEQNAKRETPRTDEFDRRLKVSSKPSTTQRKELRDFARTLETELAELRQAADGMAREMEKIANLSDGKNRLYEGGCQGIAIHALARYRALAGEGK